MRLPAGRNQAPLAQLGSAGSAANTRADYVEQSAPDSRRAPCVDTSSEKCGGAKYGLPHAIFSSERVLAVTIDKVSQSEKERRGGRTSWAAVEDPGGLRAMWEG